MYALLIIETIETNKYTVQMTQMEYRGLQSDKITIMLYEYKE